MWDHDRLTSIGSLPVVPYEAAVASQHDGCVVTLGGGLPGIHVHIAGGHGGSHSEYDVPVAASQLTSAAESHGTSQRGFLHAVSLGDGCQCSNYWAIRVVVVVGAKSASSYRSAARKFLWHHQEIRAKGPRFFHEHKCFIARGWVGPITGVDSDRHHRNANGRPVGSRQQGIPAVYHRLRLNVTRAGQRTRGRRQRRRERAREERCHGGCVGFVVYLCHIEPPYFFGRLAWPERNVPAYVLAALDDVRAGDEKGARWNEQDEACNEGQVRHRAESSMFRRE
jgi:hypothetical protein